MVYKRNHYNGPISIDEWFIFNTLFYEFLSNTTLILTPICHSCSLVSFSLTQLKPCSVTRDRRHATSDSRHILSHVARQKMNVCSVTCDTINSFHTKMTSIELLQDELIIASAAFIIPVRYSAKQKWKRRCSFHSNVTSMKTDTWDIYVTLLNELSAFGKTFKQQIVNSSPKYCIS